MPSKSELRSILRQALSQSADVVTAHVPDADSYIANARASLLAAECEPFEVSAVVMPPAFPDHPEGDTVDGYCLARRAGYWLVYSPGERRFYCFWGSEATNLGAHGVYGSPLACWLA